LFSTPSRPVRLWGPFVLLCHGCGKLFPWRLGVRAVVLATRLYLVPGSGGRGHILPPPNTPSWRGAQLKHIDNCTFTFTFYLLILENCC